MYSQLFCSVNVFANRNCCDLEPIRTLPSYALEHMTPHRLTLHLFTIIWIAFGRSSWPVLILKALHGVGRKALHPDSHHFIMLLLNTVLGLFTFGCCEHLVLAYIVEMVEVDLLVMLWMWTMPPVSLSVNFSVTCLLLCIMNFRDYFLGLIVFYGTLL